jgi:hypothetical protein
MATTASPAAGAMFTDAVTPWTALVLLRVRYRFIEEIEEFAEEIVLAAYERAYERGENGPRWMEPLSTAARALAEAAEPRANISREERSENVGRALDILKADSNWFQPILDWRVGESR